jgi:Putative Flp pilus-assembly TadE/G-like
MIRRVRGREQDERGVILIIFACAMVVLIGILAIAIDGSYGFVQNRRAQNASDFAAFAAAQQLSSSYYCNGTSAITTVQLVDIIQKLVDENDAGVGSAWSATFLDSQGNSLSSFTPSDYPTDPPPNSCGVNVTATPKWPPFFAGIFGVQQFGGFAKGSVAPVAATTDNIGIVALNKYGPHEILGGGTGEFVVSGNIFLNTDVAANPWSGNSGGWGWDDAIDAKDGSNLNVYGTIDSQTSTYNGQQVWPLDTCFEAEGVLGDVETNPASTTQTQLSSGGPPSVQMSCAEYGGSVTINYDNINPNNTPIADPLSANGAPPNPLDATLPCPGEATMAQNPATTVVDGITQYSPGQYTTPVDITTNATFEPCPGGNWGVYDFEDGLAIDPPAGDTVSGSNIVIGTQAPYPMGGNVSATGSGNGAPCLPAGTMSSVPSGAGTSESEVTANACWDTTPTTYGVVAYTDSPIAPDPTMSGTGSNFSLMIGGGGTVNLSGPTNGAFGGTNGQPGVVLYQDPSTQANYGFNAEAGDAATINLTGVVYNASLADYGADSPLDYWDGVGGGIPFYAGGTLQTGYGTGWSNGPTQSGGTVTLTGSAIVDDFNTDGATGITIYGKPYSLRGDSTLSLIG